MKVKMLSTDDVAERHRFDYWQNCVCDAFVNLDCASPIRTKFSGSIQIKDIADLQLILMSSDEMTLLRSTRQITRSREDYLLLPLECRRKSYVKQDSREAALSCGDFALVDSTRRYEVRFEEGFHHTVLKIPRQLMLQRIGHVDQFTGVRVDGGRGAGRLASRYIELLSHEADGMSEEALRRISSITLDLLVAALAAGSEKTTISETSVRTAWRIRIKGFIDDHLSEPDLTPLAIAHALRVSPRYINSILAADEIATSEYIWSRRLEKSHESLADRLQAGRSISDIAFSLGFNDSCHFSRRFKMRYGQSPREFRASLKRSI